MSKLFSSDPLFWALVNSERREIARENEYGMNNHWDSFLWARKNKLRIFGYGWLVEERNRRVR